jgi:hypothetical protein
MTPVAHAHRLERALAEVLEEEKWLLDDLDRAVPFRLFRQARRSGAEPALESVFRGLRKALDDHPDLAKLLRRFDRAYDEVLARAANPEVALRKLAKERARWRSMRDVMRKRDRSGTEDLVAWLERDIEERFAIARSRGRRPQPTARKPGEPHKKPTKAELKAAKRAEAAAIKRAGEEARRTYEAFVTAMAESDPDSFYSFAKLAAYFKPDDPVWGRIADKVARAGSPRKAVNAIQGVLGEALAMRHAWVVDSIVRATKRAERLAERLGPDWEVVYTELPVVAGTKSGGMGELYDASIWVVRKSKGKPDEVLEAAPVFVLQVKSGTVSEATDQMRKDFTRELSSSIVRLPLASGVKPTPATRDYRIQNLHGLMRREGVAPARGRVGELTTQRVLVAPRPPSDRSIHRLPPGTAIEYVEGLMQQRRIKRCSDGVAKALRRGRAA